MGAFGPIAIGALAIGSMAIGAIAIGAVTIRRMQIKQGHFIRLVVEDLRVDRLAVGELIIDD
ncbi:MAG: hypothetical protein KDC39_04340 [Actinobacteria bacterium]|nr:hypothetical protein [Actinomycetota bacterium]